MTETTIAELADQLRAWLDADQEGARLAGAGSWYVECEYGPGDCPPACACSHRRIEGDGDPGITIYNEGGHDEDQADHIARHDPARVLAEVASKRALLDLALGWKHYMCEDGWYSCSQAGDECYDDFRRGDPCDCGRDERVLAVLQHLAQPYRAAGAQEGL